MLILKPNLCGDIQEKRTNDLTAAVQKYIYGAQRFSILKSCEEYYMLFFLVFSFIMLYSHKSNIYSAVQHMH